MKVFTTFFMLAMFPLWLVKACAMSAIGVSLIVARQILDLWAGHPAGANNARRKQL